jgi:Glycine rich protein
MTKLKRISLIAITFLLFGRLHAQSTNFSYTGTVVTYTIPTAGEYQLTAAGASGAASQTGKTGGLGALVGEVIYLTNGTILSIAVGGSGINYANSSYEGGGGGGGTFVYTDTSTPILIAGGGGGGSGWYLSPYGYAGGSAITNQSGSGFGGSAGSGGAGGGAGFFGSDRCLTLRFDAEVASDSQRRRRQPLGASVSERGAFLVSLSWI